MTEAPSNIPVRTPSPTLKRWGLRSFYAVGFAAFALVLYLFNPSQHGFYPFCLLHKLTGWLCPGCGSLRAFHELLHGHFVDAFRLNPLVVTLIPLAGFHLLHCWRRRVRDPDASWAVSERWIWIGIVVLIVFGVLRNLPWFRGE